MTSSPRDSGDQVADVVRAALTVPGVAAVRVEPDEKDGLALLRLELAPGADEQQVAQAVDARLRARLGLEGQDSPEAAQEPPAAAEPSEVPEVPAQNGAQAEADALDEPEVFSGVFPTSPKELEPPPPQQVPQPPPQQQTPPSRTTPPRRVSVPAIAAPSVAAPAAPQWVTGSAGDEHRLVLERVQQVTEGMTTTSTVVLSHGTHLHTGVADGAATVGGAHRSLAAATARALESAASGRLRLDVHTADLVACAGERTAVVVLNVMTRRGAERLSGASIAGEEAGRAVVKAVLAACNRRISLELAAI